MGINPRSLFLTTPNGNLLYDVNALPDSETVGRMRALGGVQAIAASHPHFYGAMCDWSAALDDATLHLASVDKQWVLRSDAPIEWWDEEQEVLPGLHLLRCGGHFEGSAVLHWAAGADGRGVLLTGDTIMVVPGSRWVSFMRAYPVLIPLPAATVRAIAARVQPLEFDRIYGNPGWEKVIERGAAEIVQRSAERYVGWLEAG